MQNFTNHHASCNKYYIIKRSSHVLAKLHRSPCLLQQTKVVCPCTTSSSPTMSSSMKTLNLRASPQTMSSSMGKLNVLDTMVGNPFEDFNMCDNFTNFKIGRSLISVGRNMMYVHAFIEIRHDCVGHLQR